MEAPFLPPEQNEENQNEEPLNEQAAEELRKEELQNQNQLPPNAQKSSPQVLKLLSVITDACTKILMKPTEENKMEEDDKSFFEFLESRTRNLKEEAAVVGDVYQTLEGYGLLEETNLRIKVVHPDEDIITMTAVQNMCFHAFGFSSGISNFNQRIAFLIQARMMMVNKAVIATIKASLPLIEDPAKRVEKETVGDGLLPTGRMKKTFNTDVYLNFLSTQTTELIRQASSVMQGLSGEEEGKQNDPNQPEEEPEFNVESAKRVGELVGIDFKSISLTGQSNQQTDDDLIMDLPDIAIISKWALKLSQANFQIKTMDGNDWDLEDIENRILQSAYEKGFNEQLDMNIWRPAKLKESYRRQMYLVYSIFWENYFGNVIPIILTTFFPWVSAQAVMGNLESLPFVTSMMDASEEEGQDGEPEQEKKRKQIKILNWYEPKEIDPNADENTGEKIMEQLATGNVGDYEAQDQVSFGRDIVQKNLDETFKERLTQGYLAGKERCKTSDKDFSNRGDYRVNLLQEIQKTEVGFKNKFSETQEIDFLYQTVHAAYGIPFQILQQMFQRGMDDTLNFLAKILNPKSPELVLPEIKKIFSPFDAIRARSATNWFGIAGIPNPTYNMWCTYLRKYDPVNFQKTNTLSDENRSNREKRQKDARSTDKRGAKKQKRNPFEDYIGAPEEDDKPARQKSERKKDKRWLSRDRFDSDEGSDEENEEANFNSMGKRIGFSRRQRTDFERKPKPDETLSDPVNPSQIFPLQRLTVPLPSPDLYPSMFKEMVLRRS